MIVYELYPLLIGYAIFVLGLAWFAGRGETREDFLIAGRNRGVFQLMCSKTAASIGATWFLSYAAFGFLYGMNMFVGLLGYALGYVLFAWLAVPRIWRWGKDLNALTMGDLVTARTQSSLAGKAMNAMVVVTSLAWVSISVAGGAKVMAFIGFPGGFDGGVVAVTCFVLVYLLLSGYKGVILTDVIQALVIVVFSAILAIELLGKSSTDTALVLSQVNDTMDIGIIIGLAMLGFGFVTSPERYQLTYAAKSAKAAQWGMGLPVVFVLGVAYILVIIGQYAKFRDPSIEPDMAFLYVMASSLPLWALSVGLVLFVAAIMSSIDSIVYAVASHAVMHSGGEVVNPRKRIRLAMALTLVVVAIIALLIRNVVDLSLLSILITLMGSVAMLYVLLGGRSAFLFLMALGGGVMCSLIGWMAIGLQPVLGVVPLLGGLFLLLIGKGIEKSHR